MENNQLVEQLGPKGLIKRHEFLRVVIQCLYSLGFKETAFQLELDSGISYKTFEFGSLEWQIVNGYWEESVDFLMKMEDLEEETRARALYLILWMWIFECLCRRDNSSALAALRKDNYALRMGEDYACVLASMFIIWDQLELDGLELDGSVIREFRNDLVMELEEALGPPIVVPQGRLEGLVELALDAQRSSCVHHNSSGAISLYEDHCCDKDHFPTETVQILQGHTNEVWFIQFSNNGKYLASSSRDCTAIIWKVPEHGNLTLKHTLLGHLNPVSFVSWSPNDTLLLTFGNEVLKLWDVETGTCMHTIIMKNPIFSLCTWLPNFEGLVFGSSRLDEFIYKFKFGESELTQLSRNNNCMITDTAIIPKGKNIICIISKRDILIWNVETDDKRIISEESAITSVSVSRDGEYLIVNLHTQEIHRWDVTGTVLKPWKYRGHKQLRFVIHSCIGGLDSMFIASGSEDSQVYIWHHRSGKPIEVLYGHSMAVNCVSWNPKWHQMLASASDDQTIRIWGPSGIKKNKQKRESS